MHKIDDPNMPPARLLQALVRRGTPKRVNCYVPRKLPAHVIDGIRQAIAHNRRAASEEEDQEPAGPAIVHDRRAAMITSGDPTQPPCRLLQVLRRHGRNRPYVYRRLSRRELSCLPLSRIVEIGTGDDILAAWRKRCRFRGSRPSLRTLLVLAASEAKDAHEDVRSIVAQLREMEERRQEVRG
jgi:hypothetical protein